ncbi:MAG: hypothetical protein IPJ34_05855 [Myxococcales bacterium]|nr:hypothetical protein [Myxococcales bacterium]
MRLFATGLALALSLAVSPVAADAPLRGAIEGSIGVLGARPDPPMQPDARGYTPVPFSGGFGFEARFGVQLGPIVAVDALLFAETALLAADARTALLVEVAPVRSFALAAGAGVGAMWTANFFFQDPSANFVFGLARVEIRPGVREAHGELVFGIEGALGRTHRGTVPEGTQVLGGRAFVGLLFR